MIGPMFSICKSSRTCFLSLVQVITYNVLGMSLLGASILIRMSKDTSRPFINAM